MNDVFGPFPPLEIRFSRIMQQLSGRIWNFYDSINNGNFVKAYTFIHSDFKKKRLDIVFYIQKMSVFQRTHGKISVDDVFMDVYFKGNGHVDHALGFTKWIDYKKDVKLFPEDWVYDKGEWYSSLDDQHSSLPLSYLEKSCRMKT